MKTLQDYTQEKMSALWKETGTIIAFSDKQFELERVKDVEYVGVGMGLIVPKINVKKLAEKTTLIHKQGVLEDIAENGKEKIILRELSNHEAYYTGEIDDAYETLNLYGFSKEDVYKMYRNKNHKF